MPLQNRVTPFGDIVATPHRGLFTGNRGIIHDPGTKNVVKAALDQQGVDRLCLRFQRPPPRRDGNTKLDGAVFPR